MMTLRDEDQRSFMSGSVTCFKERLPESSVEADVGSNLT